MNNRLQFIQLQRNKDGIRHYTKLNYQELPLSIGDIYVITTVGDRLDLLANQFYGDVRLWWIISSANMNEIRRDSFALKPGIEIRIPYNIEDILSDFEEINQSNNEDDGSY